MYFIKKIPLEIHSAFCFLLTSQSRPLPSSLLTRPVFLLWHENFIFHSLISYHNFKFLLGLTAVLCFSFISKHFCNNQYCFIIPFALVATLNYQGFLVKPFSSYPFPPHFSMLFCPIPPLFSKLLFALQSSLGLSLFPSLPLNSSFKKGFRASFYLFIFFKLFFGGGLFIYLFMAVLGLRFCARAFSSCGKRGPLFIAVRGPLTIAASLVAGHPFKQLPQN